jgi:hypothetical protein
LLAGSPNGVTEALMMAHGFTSETLAELLRDELAITEQQFMRAGGRLIEATWMLIADAGRRSVGA